MADVIDFVESQQREIDRDISDIQDTLMSGNLKDMEHYKFLQGKLEALYNMQDFIKNYFKQDD